MAESPKVSDAEKLLYGPLDIQRALGIGRSNAYRLITDGTIPTVRLGRLVRVRRVDLEAFINGLAESPSSNGRTGLRQSGDDFKESP